MRKIPLIKPFISQKIKDKVLEVLESGYLTEGPVTHELEQLFCDYIGSSNAIAFTSCTTGLETALRALNISHGDEVIIPDYTYPATASVVSIVGAKPIILDINPETMLIDYDQLEQAVTSKTKAILPVSLFGNPLDYDRLNKIKNDYGLKIVEDAACSVGASFQNERVGKHADLTVFSMHPRKFITTGEGGMLVTDDTELASWINSYKHFGMNTSSNTSAVSFQQIGTNYKLSNLLSAIGTEQMKQVDSLLERRLSLATHYKTLLKDIDDIKLPITTKSGIHSYQSFCIFINNRDEVMLSMRNKGIEVQIGTYALHQHPAYHNTENCKIHGAMTGSKYAFEHALVLPLYHELTEDDQEYIIQQLLDSIRMNKS